jgi:hypothetical protein
MLAVLSRWNARCSHFATPRRSADTHRLKLTRRLRCGGLLEHDVIELLCLPLVKLGHEVAVAVERGLNRDMAEPEHS